ncbi:MAG: EamA family transporter, partial [Alicyclobacillaceae bacterium]|nr:EamA family transporter [Alicyclobacillaceae bacterium]
MNLRAWGMLIMLAVVWGATFPFLRIAAPAVGPIWLIFFRVALAALIMTAGIRLTQTPVPWRQTWKGMLWLGFINAALPFVFIAAAELTLPSGLASLINATTPMFTLLVAALAGQERLTLRQLGGMVLSFLGVAILLDVSPSVHGTSTIWAPLASLGAALCYAVGTV